MIKYILLFVVLLVVNSGVSQQNQQTREEYIQKYYKLAISEMERSGIPASIIMAQGCWESQNGNSELATEGNNHFGIKCKSDWTGKQIFHDDDAKHECFRKYAHAEASYIDHTNFLMAGSRYSSLFQLDPKDYTGWAYGLKKAGYATDPIYAERLIKIIEDFKLYDYDEYGETHQLASIKHQKQKRQEVEKQTSLNTPSAQTNDSQKIEMRNGLRSIVVREGDTYQSITKKYALKDWELYTYNDLKKGSQPQVNEILYIQPKHNRTNQTHKQHIAEDGDTMHYIAQLYALKLKSLLRRNRMKEGDEPVIGQIIYLRNKRPRNEQ